MSLRRSPEEQEWLESEVGKEVWPSIEPVAVGGDGWSEWLHPTAPSFFSQCCDCGLIHEMEFEIVPCAGNAALNPGEGDEGVIIFRVRRAVPEGQTPVKGRP